LQRKIRRSLKSCIERYGGPKRVAKKERNFFKELQREIRRSLGMIRRSLRKIRRSLRRSVRRFYSPFGGGDSRWVWVCVCAMCVCVCVCVCVRSTATNFCSRSSDGRVTHTLSHVFDPRECERGVCFVCFCTSARNGFLLALASQGPLICPHRHLSPALGYVFNS
jgi:hypothetical protein